MFEQDYIMRQIHQFIRVLVKMLFNIDSEFTESQLLEYTNSRETAGDLLKKIDDGNINAVENELFELIEDRTKDNLLTGIVFYSYLNEKDDAFLEANDFSRDETEDGIRHLLSEYKIEGMDDFFL
ncbi:MAG: hypothetical protein J1E40_04415 [Oscillospiraceae bacterium]|nr:hypothetical protein [Oscillospiraceae bacterium]